jgi:RNA polymerase sigma-70 factor (ECF subfamily)
MRGRSLGGNISPCSSGNRSIRRTEDQELVARCQLGDVDAWRRLHDRYTPLITGLVRRLGVPSAEYQDAVQDVLIVLFRNLGRFRGDAQLSTWIYRIARRHATRLWRRRQIRDRVMPPGTAAPAVAPDAMDRAERATNLILLEMMLGKLKAKKRKVLVLFEIDGLSVDEIARVVRCPENTVWSRLYHARAEMVRMARLAECEQ